MPEPQTYDVIVVGGGNAGLVAAISARHSARSVLLLERAPTWRRGGNSRHTRDIRYAHPPGQAFTTGEAYPEEELLEDLLRVGGGHNRQLAQLVVEQSATAPEWMSAHGVRWQQPLTGTLHLGRTNIFFLGGGKALMNTYYQTAEAMGVEVEYDTTVSDVLLEPGGAVRGVVAERDGQRCEVLARAVVLTSGGFEANLDWLRRYWGDAVNNYVIRGTPYNDGRVLASMLDKGAATAGDPKGFHAVALDARAPKFDGGIATRLDAVPFGIAVNKYGKRFYDEGQDFWPKRYAIWGRLIAEQPDQIAYSFVDSRTIDRFLTSLYRPYEGGSVAEVAAAMGLDANVVDETVSDFNASIRPGGSFDPAVLDDCTTVGLDPPKSHWAVPISQPPFYGYALRPGITFTYLGLAVDACARVQMADGSAIGNLFAAGEIMSGNILSSGYLGGFGLTIGTVFGRIAGAEAGQWRMADGAGAGTAGHVTIPDTTFWQLEVCNACRYCEGYCAVFPALERRRRFTPTDVVYLSNLCHDCRACFYACMYAPPHEFGVNIPQALAEVREQTYGQYAIPRIVSDLARRNGWLLAIVTVVSVAFFAVVAAFSPAGLFQARQGPGAFYAVIPYLAMMLPALVVSLYAIGVLVLGAVAFARDIGGSASVGQPRWRSVLAAAGEALGLRYLRGGMAGGCYYPSERTSNARLVLHMLVFYGFASAFVATVIAAILQDILDQFPPYPLLSLPVVFGTLGGVAIIVGASGLLYLKWRSDRQPADLGSMKLDWLFLVSLDVVSVTGMLLLVLRESPLMGVLLVVHLATVLALYVSAPYGKFAHFVYRYIALVQNRLESAHVEHHV